MFNKANERLYPCQSIITTVGALQRNIGLYLVYKSIYNIKNNLFLIAFFLISIYMDVNSIAEIIELRFVSGNSIYSV